MNNPLSSRNNILVLFIFLIQSHFLFSQTPPDSIITKYNAAAARDKFYFLENYMLSFVNNDSLWAKKQIELRTYLEKRNDNAGVNYLDLCIANIWREKKDWTRALGIAVPLLSKFKARNDTVGILAASGTISYCYEFSKNFKEAVEYHKQILPILLARGAKLSLAMEYNNIGSIYAQAFMPDSGLHYAQKSLALYSELKTEKDLSAPVSTLAENYIANKDYDLAMPYLRRAIRYTFDHTSLGNRLWIYNDFAQAFLGMKQYDSAYYYVRKSLEISSPPQWGKDQVLRSYEYLHRIFENTGPKDSADKYFRLSTMLKDELFGIEKAKAIEAINFRRLLDEAKSEQERKDGAAQAEIERQKMARNGFIAGFGLMLLFAVIFLLQRNKIRRVNAELIIAKERAEQSEKFKQQFLANMSHEIRTPMNGVMGMTNILLEKSPKPEQIKHLNTIKKSSENLLVIVNDILDLSKIEAGKMEVEQIDLSLREVVETVGETLQHKVEEKGLQFKTNYDDLIPEIIVGDPTRINQILTNLLGNAIKFTEKGYVSLKVNKHGQNLQFTISDSGIGMTKEQQSKVFEVFQQAEKDTSRKFGGTGLGLSISKKLIELQGGTIEVESERGKGTTFYFTLPLIASEKKQIQKKETELTTEVLRKLDGIKILLAEDNEYNREVAVETLNLKLKDIAIDCAHNGAEVIEKLQHGDYDIILMDVQMPILDGYETTQKIRKELHSSIPVLALTASVIRSDISKCLDAGMNGYVPKPFKTYELFSAMFDVLKERNKTVKTVNEKKRVTDLTFLKEFCEGDEVRMKKYISMYLNSAPKSLQMIKHALEKQDYSTVQKTVHQLKAHLRYMGMKETAETADEIERACIEKIDLESLQLQIFRLTASCQTSYKELA